MPPDVQAPVAVVPAAPVSEMVPIQKPAAAPPSPKEKLAQGRRAALADAMKLVPKDAMSTLTGDADQDDGADPFAPAPAEAPTPVVAPVVAKPEAPAPKGAEGAPNPWDKVTEIEAAMLDLKKAYKAQGDLLAKFNQAPTAPATGLLSPEDIRKDPLAALKAAGLTYQDLTNRIVSGGPTVDDALAEAARAREASLAEVTAVRGEITQLRNGLIKERLELGFHKTLTTDPRFDLLASDPESAVTEAISHLAKHFNETGERLPDQSVLATVQRNWVDRLRKLDSNQAARRHLGLQSGTPAPAPQSAVAPQTNGPGPSANLAASPAIPPTTLTNDVGASSPRTEPLRNLGNPTLNRRAMIADATKRFVPPNPFGEDDE